LWVCRPLIHVPTKRSWAGLHPRVRMEVNGALRAVPLLCIPMSTWTALPDRALEGALQRRDQPLVGVGDDELHADDHARRTHRLLTSDLDVHGVDEDKG